MFISIQLCDKIVIDCAKVGYSLCFIQRIHCIFWFTLDIDKIVIDCALDIHCVSWIHCKSFVQSMDTLDLLN
jgi:hypothetical protein